MVYDIYTPSTIITHSIFPTKVVSRREVIFGHPNIVVWMHTVFIFLQIKPGMQIKIE